MRPAARDPEMPIRAEQRRRAEDRRPETDQSGADRQTASLAGLAATLLILVLALLIVRALHAECAIEDCFLSGYADCRERLGVPLL